LKILLSAAALGIAAGLLTIFVIPENFEILVWLVLIVCIGLLSAQRFEKSLFKNTFTLSILTGVVITATHLLLFEFYTRSHPNEIASLSQLKLFGSMRLTLLLFAPIYWFLLGVLAGSCSMLFLKMRRDRTANQAMQ